MTALLQLNIALKQHFYVSVVYLSKKVKVDGSRILEFADGLNLVVCNTLFTKQEAKLVTYVAGPVKSTVWWWNEE